MTDINYLPTVKQLKELKKNTYTKGKNRIQKIQNGIW